MKLTEVAPPKFDCVHCGKVFANATQRQNHEDNLAWVCPKFSERSKQMQLPSAFDSGEDFSDFVYNRWDHPDTHVEHQGGGAWYAQIGGDPKISHATYDEREGTAAFMDEDYNPI